MSIGATLAIIAGVLGASFALTALPGKRFRGTRTRVVLILVCALFAAPWLFASQGAGSYSTILGLFVLAAGPLITLAFLAFFVVKVFQFFFPEDPDEHDQ